MVYLSANCAYRGPLTIPAWLVSVLYIGSSTASPVWLPNTGAKVTLDGTDWILMAGTIEAAPDNSVPFKDGLLRIVL